MTSTTSQPTGARKRKPRKVTRAQLAKKVPEAVLGHVSTIYALNVVEGKIPACKLRIAACQRQLNDLVHGPKRGLYFSLPRADHAMTFFPKFLRHSKGEFGNHPFELSDWQAFTTSVLFGWLYADTLLRRFIYAYFEVPRKNGKSTYLSGIGLYMFVMDGEPGAEVYTAATKSDQAKIIFLEAQNMVRKSPKLRKHISSMARHLEHPRTASVFKYISSDAKTQDGLNSHCNLVDEVHAHKDRTLIEVLETGIGARRQPLHLEITTAGSDPYSICREHHDYTVKVMTGVLDDDSWFGFICSIDKGDDPFDEQTWRKANPNWGISVRTDTFKKIVDKARQNPASLASFMRLRLNVWSQTAEIWLDIRQWDKCEIVYDRASLRGRRCYAGLDMSSVSDITAPVLVFPPETAGEPVKILPFFFVPSATIDKRAEDRAVPYGEWEQMGLIRRTEGSATDYDAIELLFLGDPDHGVEGLRDEFEIVEMAFDRMFAGQIIQHFEAAGMVCVSIGQGMYSMAAPCRELERLVINGGIAHDGNPVMTWMVSNTAVKVDEHDNKKPIKPDSRKDMRKIDGVVAMLMAIGRMISAEPDQTVSVESIFGGVA
ncbi:terminase large subunit [Thalassospira lohafexi]|uniref:Terminase n=1 Tax=Thalassospira lohafexi TaxID=744227 RepID=A0A2N3L3V6_9PROT|nr:terminase TerL endonuclease subunit [Thalassospira lohafexi]PKR57495.1 terminase [Thalassospira lohafexi]